MDDVPGNNGVHECVRKKHNDLLDGFCRDSRYGIRSIPGDEWKAYYYHYMMYGAKEIATGQRANFMK